MKDCGGKGTYNTKNREHFKIIQDHRSNFVTVEVFKVRKIWLDGGITQESSRKGLKFYKVLESSRRGGAPL